MIKTSPALNGERERRIMIIMHQDQFLSYKIYKYTPFKKIARNNNLLKSKY